MVKTHIKTVSEQSAVVYNLLQHENREMSAQEIAKSLDILPNAVYRVANRLVELGMLSRVESWPMKFKAVPANSAMNWYLLAVAQNFREDFVQDTQDKKKDKSQPEALNISFIRDRKNLLERTNRDAREAKKSINFIVSGLEVPDDTVLAFRRASAKGVVIRAIVQKRKETSKEKLEKWQDLGAETRYLHDIGVRMFIFDSRIVYITSYSSSAKEKAFGIRFMYPPVAVQMEALFEQNWQRAKNI